MFYQHKTNNTKPSTKDIRNMIQTDPFERPSHISFPIEECMTKLSNISLRALFNYGLSSKAQNNTKTPCIKRHILMHKVFELDQQKMVGETNVSIKSRTWYLYVTSHSYVNRCLTALSLLTSVIISINVTELQYLHTSNPLPILLAD